MDRAELLKLAAMAEAGGNPDAAEGLRAMATAEPDGTRAPPPAPSVEAPPPGPRADQSPYIGMTVEEITAARASQPPPPPMDVSPEAGGGAPLPPMEIDTHTGMPPREEWPDDGPAPVQAGAGREYVPWDTGNPVMGRPRDVEGDFHKLEGTLAETVSRLTEQYLSEGMTLDQARARAATKVRRVEELRVDPEGLPTTRGEGGLHQGAIPFFRETRIRSVAERHPDDPSRTVYVDKYRDPDTGEYSDPTSGQRMWEAAARQRVLDPQEVERMRVARTLERRQALRLSNAAPLNEEAEEDLRRAIVSETDPAVSGLLTALNPETGAVIETPFGAALRYLPAIYSTALNTSVMNYLPLFWEQDPETGEPLDPNDPAYLVQRAAANGMARAGMSEMAIVNSLSGTLGPTRIPMPFQPIQRQQGHSLDATGRRTASASGSYIMDVAVNLERGRFAGDEAMSVPGYRQGVAAQSWGVNTSFDQRVFNLIPGMKPPDSPLAEPRAGVLGAVDTMWATMPFWQGVAIEAVYGMGPLALLRGAARASAAAAKAASRTAGATAGAARSAAEAAQATAQASTGAYAAGAATRAAVASTVGKAAGAAETAAKAGEKVAQAAGHPIEAMKRAVTIRAAQDLAEGRVTGLSDFDTLLERHNVRRVTGERIAEEALAPWALDARIVTGKPVTLGELRDLAQGSASGRAILEEVGLHVGAPSRLASAAETRAVREAASRFKTSAQRVRIRNAAASGGTEAEQASRVLGVLQDQGIPARSVAGGDELIAIARGEDARPLGEVLDELLEWAGESATPVRPTNPVLQTIHDLGRNLTEAALRRQPTPVRGPLGRIVERRLGTAPSQADVANRADEVFAAARAGAGRAVEATLENVMPDDLVFVTRTMMMPRRAVTPEVVDAVAKRMEHVQAVATQGPRVDGVPTTQFTYPAARLEQGLVDALGEHGAYRIFGDEIRATKAGKPVSADAHTRIQEALLTDAFQREAAASPAVFAGRQVERADVEGVNVGMGSARGERVARKHGAKHLAQDAWAAAETAASAVAVARASRRTAKSWAASVEPTILRTFPPQTPAPLARTLADLDNTVTALGDVFMREVRDTVREVRADGGTPQDAFDTVVNRRVARDIDDAVRAVEQEVDRLVHERGMSEVEAYYLAGYQAGTGSEFSGLGELSRQMDEVLPADLAQRVKDRAVATVVQDTWASLLETFFGAVVYNSRVKPQGFAAVLKPGIKATAETLENPASYRAPTVEQFHEVLELLRERNPDLAGRGLARRRVADKLAPTDAIFDTLAAHAVGRDRARATQQATRRLRDEYPELHVQLIPSDAGNRPQRMATEAVLPVRVRGAVLGALRTLAEDGGAAGPTAKQWQELLAIATVTKPGEVGRAGAYVLKDQGRFSTMVDTLSHELLTNIDAGARREIIHAAFNTMLQEGTTALDYEKLVGGLDAPRLSQLYWRKGTVTAKLDGMLSKMDLAVAEAQLALGPSASRMDVMKAAFKGSDADVILYMSVKQAREAGTPDDKIVGAIRQTVVRQGFEALVAPALSELQANARAMGFVPEAGPAAQANLVSGVGGLNPNDPSFLLYGQEYADAVARLRTSANTGRLADNLEALRQRDRLTTALKGEGKERGAAAGAYAGHVIASALGTSRAAAASAMLGGGWYVGTMNEDSMVPVVLPAPNTRYVGTNLITAPLIALTTVGGYQALRMMSGPGMRMQAEEVAAQLAAITRRPLPDALSPRPAADVVFTAATGRRWTYGELTEAMDRSNIQITRGDVEFTEAFIGDLRREAQVLADGTPAGPLRQFLRHFDPLRTNLPQYVANATDRAFRMNTFAAALREGVPEAQAAELARAVVLDYGAVPGVVKQSVNKYVLFATFRAAMTTEAMRALARDPDTFSRLALTHRNQQQFGDQFLLGPDYTKTRLMFDPREHVYEGRAGASLYGPVTPPMDAYKDVLNVAAYMAQLGGADNEAGRRLARAVADENLVPAASYLVESWMGEGLRGTDPGWKVPAQWVAWAAANGSDTTWPAMREAFNIVPVTDERRRTPGRATYLGNEWRFETQADQTNFKAAMVAATYLGIKRTTEDYTRIGMTYSPADYLEPYRYGLPATLGFLTGAQTPVGVPEPDAQVNRALFEQQRAAQALQPRGQ